MDRQQLLKQLDKAWAAIKESYAGLSDSQLTEPGVTGDWSVKDIIAHVTWWEEEALKHLPLILRGGRPPQYSRQYGGIDAFNAQMTEQKRGLSLADVLRQLEETHRRLIIASQRPIALAANIAPTETAAWKTLPSWAVIGTEDRVIPPDTQRSMAQRARSTITEINASHVSMVSQPQTTIDAITAAAATSADSPWVDARLAPGRTTRLQALVDDPSLTVLVRPDRVIAAVATQSRPPRPPWIVP